MKIFIFTFVFCIIEVPTSIIENRYDKISLGQETKLLLLHNYHNSSEMYIEIMLSSPSKYELTFNQYKNDYKNPLKNLSYNYNYNQTNLIIKEEANLGKSRIYLNLVINGNNTIEEILLVIKKRDISTNNKDNIMIRYILNENEEKYILKNNKINIVQQKNILNITFGGIIPYSDEINLINISAIYTIDLIDKKSLDLYFENIYFYAFSENNNIFLYHKELKLKGNSIKYDNYIRIKAPLNEKNEQIIFIKAEIKNYGNIFIYEIEPFKVSEIIKRKRKENDQNQNREENKPILLIIMGLFGGSVILTLIFVFIYLKINEINGSSDKKEQEYDYKNIGEIKTVEEDDI